MNPVRTHVFALAVLGIVSACSEPATPATPQKPQPAEAAPAPAPATGALLDPAKANATAPETFTVKLATTKGDLLLDVHRSWSPNGADRFYNLVRIGYYDDVAFFRVISGFMAQTGIHGDPKVNAAWRNATITDDPVRQQNRRGFVSFATGGPDTRTTQFFINLQDNLRLDKMGFSPFAQLQPASLAVLDALHSGYGEGAPNGKGPVQGRIQAEGNAYLRADFARLDWIQKATIQ